MNTKFLLLLDNNDKYCISSFLNHHPFFKDYRIKIIVIDLLYCMP